MQKALSRRWMLLLFLAPGFLLFVVFFIVPVGMTFYYSLHRWDGISAMAFVGLGNYRKMFLEDSDFARAVWNGLIFVACAVAVQLPLAFGLALLVAKKLRGIKWFRDIFFLPVILSTTMVGLLWTKIYDPSTGLLNETLRHLGLSALSRAWLGGENTALLAVVWVVVWQFIGYHMLIMFAGLQSIPEPIYEAARIDGASGWTSVTRITLPLLSDVLKIDVVLAVIGSLKVFEQVYVMTAGGPINSSTVVALRMFQEAFLKQNFGYGSSLAVFLVAECILIAWIINWLFRRERLEF
jgi:raffinose/stachyose/melibiose transport system permease protein